MGPMYDSATKPSVGAFFSCCEHAAHGSCASYARVMRVLALELDTAVVTWSLAYLLVAARVVSCEEGCCNRQFRSLICFFSEAPKRVD